MHRFCHRNTIANHVRFWGNHQYAPSDGSGHDPTVLSHHVRWLVEDYFLILRSRFEWLYALLARMEKPLHREEAALLRRLLRNLRKRRLDLGGAGADEQKYYPLLPMMNILIAIAGLYSEQGPNVMTHNA
mmetsp:Transcript_58371/g.68173  ORF Transcript_58371/g.68173 Transcript_58371/m.68173 type:complete len:130 (-) Transcript_58371:51-440(-)